MPKRFDRPYERLTRHIKMFEGSLVSETLSTTVRSVAKRLRYVPASDVEFT